MKKALPILSFIILALILTSSALAQYGTTEEETSTTANMVIDIASNNELGSFLVNANGWTVYTFTNDTAGVSNCSGDCLVAWPAVTVASEDELANIPAGIAGRFGVITRGDDSSLQVTLDDQPLYTFANDEQPGDTNGQGAGDVWFVAEVDAWRTIDSDVLSSFMVNVNDFPLYIFTNDTPGVSNCADACAEAWPPVTVGSVDILPPAPQGVTAQLGVIERTDGTLQVTFNDQPLYTFANDDQAGVANGQGAGDVWFVIEVETFQSAENASLGNILVDSEGMTVYTFTNDVEGISTCFDACAEAWPPVLVEADEYPSALNATANALGVIERNDGTTQVTFGGMPLYYFADDAQAGDANGQGAGDVWFVVELSN